MVRRRLYQYCHEQKRVVPIEEIKRVSKVTDYFIQDEMPPTRNPLNPNEIYTSKSKLRAAYKAAGAVEVGDAYERGYKPEVERNDSAKLVSSFMNQVRERLNNGR